MRNFRHLHLKVLLDLRSSPTGCQSSYLFPSKPWRPHQQHTSHNEGYSPKYAVGGDGGSRTRVRKTFSQSDIQLKLNNTTKPRRIQYLNKHKSRVISMSYFDSCSSCRSFSHPCGPSSRTTAILRSKITEGSGYCSAALSRLSSRNRCRMGYGARLV